VTFRTFRIFKTLFKDLMDLLNIMDIPLMTSSALNYTFYVNKLLHAKELIQIMYVVIAWYGDVWRVFEALTGLFGIPRSRCCMLGINVYGL